MTHTSSFITSVEREVFDNATHLFSTNTQVNLHNKNMLKSLNRPIALSIGARSAAPKVIHIVKDEEQLNAQVLLCQGQRIMLTSKIWTQVGLVNGTLGEIVDIIYSSGSKPPEVPLYIVTRIDNYIGSPWNEEDPKLVPIIPLCLGSRRQISITMDWAITICKS